MDFNVGMAVVGGLIGAIAMTAVMYMGSLMMTLKMDMPMTLGTMFLPKGKAAWGLGMMVHLMMGMVFFIVYATLISAFSIGSGIAVWGALFGVVHGLIAGAAFGMMPALHPRMAADPASVPGQFKPQAIGVSNWARWRLWRSSWCTSCMGWWEARSTPHRRCA